MLFHISKPAASRESTLLSFTFNCSWHSILHVSCVSHQREAYFELWGRSHCSWNFGASWLLSLSCVIALQLLCVICCSWSTGTKSDCPFVESNAVVQGHRRPGGHNQQFVWGLLCCALPALKLMVVARRKFRKNSVDFADFCYPFGLENQYYNNDFERLWPLRKYSCRIHFSSKGTPWSLTVW